MLPLLPLHLADPGPKPLDLAKKLSSSLGKIAPSHWTYIILPEEEVSLGAAATELALAWLWQNTPQEGHPAKLSKLGTLAKALSECEPSFGFDEDTLASFLKSLGAKAHQEMVQWLEKIGIKSRGKRPLAMTLGALVCPSWLCSKGRAEGIAMAIRAHLKELIEAPEHHSTDKGTWRF